MIKNRTMIDIEDKCSLNLDKFNLYLIFFHKLSIVFNNTPADMD